MSTNRDADPADMSDADIDAEIGRQYAARNKVDDLESWDHSRLRALQHEEARRMEKRFRERFLMPAIDAERDLLTKALAVLEKYTGVRWDFTVREHGGIVG